MKKAKDVLNKPFSSHFMITVIQGCFVGFITGFVVSLFRWIIDQTLRGLGFIYPQMAHNYLWLIPYLFLMVIICLALEQIMNNYHTDLVGSGVPQIEAIMAGKHSMNWFQVLWRKFVGGLLAICPGLFLGREGPCIQMGAAIGQGVSQVISTKEDNTQTLLACGVAAGLSAAFSAPLAGTMFLLEEIIFAFKPQIWLTALASSITADAVTIVFFGTRPCLYLPTTTNLPVRSYVVIIILGVIIGLFAYIYQYCLLNLHWWYSKIRWLPVRFRSIIPLVLIIPVGLWNPKLLGGGHLLINIVTKQGSHFEQSDITHFITLMVMFFIIRFIISMVSYGASVPGGIFMPILALGALLGSILAALLIQSNIIPASAFVNIVAMTMAAYFGAIEMAPFTAILLLTEMVGSIEQILPMTIMTFVAYVVIDILGGRPIYTALREEIFAHKL